MKWRWLGLAACLWSLRLWGHGGVVAEDDLCIIEIGVYTAHFTVYQTATRGNEEFCEELPATGEALFVMDYLHPNLDEVPVDFRIIRDVLGRAQYAAAADLQLIDDLDAATVFYQPPVVRRGGSFQVETRLDEPGWYVGIVTAPHPKLERTYTAVFGFQVGAQGWGFWPWVVLGLLAVQLQYWLGSGGWARWRAARAGAGTDAQ
jgi:hypothetical protein